MKAVISYLQLTLLFIIISLVIPSSAYASTFYVATSGNDANPGSQTSPFKTFSKSMSMLKAGDTLLIAGGTYNEQLDVTVSGSANAPITIKPISGQKVILDGVNYTGNTVQILATRSNINLSNLEVKRGYECVQIKGSTINIDGFDVHDCQKFGYRITGKSITIENSTCHDNVLENIGGTNTSGGWGSCLKTGPGSGDLIIRNNDIYNNWGEGLIIGQAAGAKAYNNRVYDNYSQNIYIGNAFNVDVYKNITYSTNSKYFRSGSPANCITASEEEISTSWGAQLHDIRVVNNIGYKCKNGLGYTYAEVSNNGCDNCLFAFNTMVDTGGVKVIPGTKNHITIANNIIRGGTLPSSTAGISLINNFTGDPKFNTQPGTSQSSYRLSSDSPLINAGMGNYNILDDFEGKERDSRPDIGAIEYSTSPTQSISPSPTPVLKPWTTLQSDYLNWYSHYLQSVVGFSNGDFSENGLVDGIDYVLWVINYAK